MKNSTQGATWRAAERSTGKKAIIVSARKIAANRQNAQKSTGPKTPIGKVYSGRNALKHGFFSRQLGSFTVHREDPGEYNQLLRGLRGYYQPVGTPEELEVERIAVCWWKQKRAWRFENGMNQIALRYFGNPEPSSQAEYCKALEKEEEAVILLLYDARKEIELTGEVSHELKQRMFAIIPEFELVWADLERDAPERAKGTLKSKVFQNASARERSGVPALHVVAGGIVILQEIARQRKATFSEISVAQHLIPDGNALDKILRYLAANDRQLKSSIDRLERMQRNRRGEIIPPPVSVHLTR